MSDNITPLDTHLTHAWLNRVFSAVNVYPKLIERDGRTYFGVYTDRWPSLRVRLNVDDTVAEFVRLGIDADHWPEECMDNRHGILVVDTRKLIEKLEDAQKSFHDIFQGIQERKGRLDETSKRVVWVDFAEGRHDGHGRH